ncbi:ricin B-like lectin EULS3 [Tripterygium wilfordii]|nr:ricin B-like lectin EULS3 [Tripterygium wilfordii]
MATTVVKTGKGIRVTVQVDVCGDQQTDSFRVFCMTNPNYSLSIRDGKVLLAPANSNDQNQHWYRNEKYGAGVKDEKGRTAFALVNKGTGQAMKHAAGDTQPVQLITFDPNVIDESLLWTNGNEWGEDCYSPIWMANNFQLNLDAETGIVKDGTPAVIYQWNGGAPNQLWKIIPHCHC